MATRRPRRRTAATLLGDARFGAYLFLNTSGTPLCCPFPSPVVAAMVLEMLRRTTSRVLLLLVSLGFGLVRPSLELKEIALIALLAIACVPYISYRPLPLQPRRARRGGHASGLFCDASFRRARETPSHSFARHVAPTAARYLVASVVSDATKIAAAHDLHSSSTGDSVALDVPVLLFDLIFLVWIYLALVNVMATLKACGQTHKLEM